MPKEMFIILGVILVIITVIFLFVNKIHRGMFNKRFERDPLVKCYDDEKLDRKPIQFECSNNVLRGFIYSYPNMNYKGLIVFSHGMFSSHLSYMQEIIYFANQGYKVIGFDYLATSLSDGKALKGFGSSLKCLDYAIRYVKSNQELSKYKLIVVGHSWGGFAASNILKYHNDIDKVVALAPFASIFNLLKGFLPKGLYWVIPFMVVIDFINCGSYSLANNIKTLKDKTNVLILHSKDDYMVKYEHNTLKLINKNNTIKSIILENKRHNPNYSDEAIKLLTEYSLKASKLKGEELVELKKSTDFLKLGELDNEIMYKIMEFVEN
jgi:alpha-beta hydrolase superfamily lysophospholipase